MAHARKREIWRVKRPILPDLVQAKWVLSFFPFSHAKIIIVHNITQQKDVASVPDVSR